MQSLQLVIPQVHFGIPNLAQFTMPGIVLTRKQFRVHGQGQTSRVGHRRMSQTIPSNRLTLCLPSALSQIDCGAWKFLRFITIGFGWPVWPVSLRQNRRLIGFFERTSGREPATPAGDWRLGAYHHRARLAHGGSQGLVEGSCECIAAAAGSQRGRVGILVHSGRTLRATGRKTLPGNRRMLSKVQIASIAKSLVAGLSEKTIALHLSRPVRDSRGPVGVCHSRAIATADMLNDFTHLECRNHWRLLSTAVAFARN